ncbi:sugar fermentation stimulation protein [Methanolobus psychrophilus R15]|nr:sugar fermentation stimulation protein [Methanolobus psychrophilus R15]
MTGKTIPSHKNLIEVLRVRTDAEGMLIARPNRFLAIVEIENNGIKEHVQVHVHDPGRLTDILFPGNRVLLRKADSLKRKTGWDMIAGKVSDDWILINSSFHGEISRWVIENGIVDFLSTCDSILPEQKYGDSRLDYLLRKDGKDIWVEVKGCTLVQDRIASFPDSPTTRGRRHVEELIKAKAEGYDAAMLILIFRPEAECFTANERIDPTFSQVFHRAIESGVRVFPVLFTYEDGSIHFCAQIPVCNSLDDKLIDSKV